MKKTTFIILLIILSFFSVLILLNELIHFTLKIETKVKIMKRKIRSVNRGGLITCGIIGLIASFSTSVNAQLRSINMELLLQAPLQNEMYKQGDTVSLEFYIKSHGPDELVIGDTVFILMPNGAGQRYTLNNNVGIGDSIKLFEGGMTLNVDETTTLDVCVEVIGDPNNSNILIDDVPVQVTYSDPNPGNNRVCHTITIESDDPSAIDRTTEGGNMALQFYPNPATDRIFVPLNATMGEAVSIRLIDLAGRTVMEKSTKAYGKKELSIPVFGLSPGLYLIELKQGVHESSGKVWIYR